MFIRALSLRNFRSWESVDIEFRTGATVFVGSNGNGKTNLVEALGYLATLASHRVSTDTALIRTTASSAFFGATVVNGGRELTVDMELRAGSSNRARINRSPARRPREILGVLNAVLFAPEDLALVRGDPSERRRFLDELLTARLPRMAAVRADYDRVLRQRSALLKTAGRNPRADLGTLEVWDGQLAEHAAVLLEQRLRLVRELTPHVSAAYRSIAPQSRPAGLRYRSSFGAGMPPELANPERAAEPDDVKLLEAVMLQELRAARAKELERGVCLVGPHRDDLDLLLGADLAKGFASHGESWSLSLSLRLASFELLRGYGTDPVLLLDDVFAELDRRRRAALAAVALDAEQVLITAAVSEDVPEELGALRVPVIACDVNGVRLSRIGDHTAEG